MSNKLRSDFRLQTRHNRDGSYATQAARRATLDLVARELTELGFRNLRIHTIGQRHIRAIVEHWRTSQLSVGTIKNRLAHLRWSLQKTGRPGVAALSNQELNIENRTFVAKESRAIQLQVAQLDKITDRHLQLSLQMQRQFGLRREECMKIRVKQADQGDRLVLQPSWAKGGRAREIPIRTPEQRALLKEVKVLTGAGSLIPADRTYKQQMKLYERQCADAGICKAHGLRHLYAQQRYLELTGRQAPAVRASIEAYLNACTTPENLQTQNTLPQPTVPEIPADSYPADLSDREARLLISEELGHSREQITTIYLGR